MKNKSLPHITSPRFRKVSKDLIKKRPITRIYGGSNKIICHYTCKNVKISIRRICSNGYPQNGKCIHDSIKTPSLKHTHQNFSKKNQ